MGATATTATCSTDDCEAPRRAKGLCKKCYQRKWRTENRELKWAYDRKWRADNPAYMTKWRADNRDRERKYRAAHLAERSERNKKYYHRLRTNGPFEDLTHLEIAERDGWRCHICGKRVTQKNWSLDHLVPVVAGGAHTRANVALAHRNCNAARGPGRIPAQLRLAA